MIEVLREFYEQKCKEQPPVAVLQAERVVTLRSVDTHWMAHIDEMSHLREQVAFSGFAQRDPVIEYQDQGFRKFQQLISAIDASIVRTLFQIDFAQFAPQAVLQRAEQEMRSLQTNEAEIEAELGHSGVGAEDVVDSERGSLISAQAAGGMQSPISVQAGGGRKLAPRPMAAGKAEDKVGRNDPCPCGSGKKYKKCHGQQA